MTDRRRPSWRLSVRPSLPSPASLKFGRRLSRTTIARGSARKRPKAVLRHRHGNARKLPRDPSIVPPAAYRILLPTAVSCYRRAVVESGPVKCAQEGRPRMCCDAGPGAIMGDQVDDHKNDSGARMQAMSNPRPSMWRSRSAGALATLGLALPMLAHAGCQVQTLELPVKMVGSRAVATVGINGTPVPLMVDSGAFFSFLTDAAVAQLKLQLSRNPGPRVEGITGRVDTHTTTVDKLQLLKGEIPRVEFIVGGNEFGAGTMGVMGRNLLSFTDTEYDLAHGVIRFLLPNDDCAKA